MELRLQKLYAENSRRTDEVVGTQVADEMTSKRKYDRQVSTTNQVEGSDSSRYEEKYISLEKHHQIVNKLCLLRFLF